MTSAWDLAGSARLRDINRATLEMERNGVALDSEGCRVAAARATADEATELIWLREWAERDLGLRDDEPAWKSGIDGIWTSPVQLQRLLHERLDIPPSPFWKKGKVKLERGEVKLDATALKYLAGTNPAHREGILRILKRRKIWGSLKYLSKLPEFVGADGFIHPVFGSAGDGDDRYGAVTGRLACKLPELAQIPGDDAYNIRTLFVAGPGKALIVVDYSALEIVIMAHILVVLFGDTQLADMVPAPGRPDIHSLNALRVFRDVLGYTAEMDGAEEWLLRPENRKEGFKNHPDPFMRWSRNMIKAIWYGLQYGKGAYGFGGTLFDQAGNPLGEKRAGAMVDGILTAIPGIRRYQEWVAEFIRRHGGIVSLLGRWADLRDLVNGDEWMFRRAWRRALNFPMQAGGADIAGALMVLIVDDRRIAELRWLLTNQIHDEVVLRGPEESADEVLVRVQNHARTAVRLALELQTSGAIGPNWADAKHA